MVKEYRSKVDSTYLPEFYGTIATRYGGNDKAYADSLYAASELTTPRGLKRFLERDTTYNIYDDPAINLGIDLIGKMFEINMQTRESAMNITRNERLLNAAVRRMYSSRNFYPDANSTMRLSFGTVCGYTPFDGAEYDYYTTTKGILEKVKTHAGDVDFEVPPELLSLFSNRDFGRYAGEKGEMNVCFISNNDITGGNSGSAMFNARGELLGLAFDGNWEAMSSDILYEPKMQRCIGVDVRYILFMIEKYGKAGDLIRELKIVSGNSRLCDSPDAVVESGQCRFGPFTHSYDNLFVGYVGHVSGCINTRKRGAAECVCLDFTGRCRFQCVPERCAVGCQTDLYEDTVQRIVALLVGDAVFDADTGYFLSVARHSGGL